MFFKSIESDYPLNKHEYRVIYGCKKGRRNWESCLKEIDGKAEHIHFISDKYSKNVSELNQYKFTQTDNSTEIVQNKSNENGNVELTLLNAINLCYQSNNKNEIILCIGTMKSHCKIRKMLGI